MEKLDDTKIKYYKRAVLLIKKAHKEAKESNHKVSKSINAYKDIEGKQFLGLSLFNTAMWFKNFWAINLRSKTLRLYRASLIYFAEIELENDRIDKENFEKIKTVLSNLKSGDPKSLELRTSAKKQKHLTVKDLNLLTKTLSQSKNRWASATIIWLISGIITGLRPIEWRSAVYDPEENKLIIKNAKNTNGRAHGEFRTFYLENINEKDKNIIIKHSDVALQFSLQGDEIWETYYQGCSNLLKYTCDILWPKRERHPTLYSARHQFSANLKASGCKPEEIATLMGHAVDTTAITTYGKKVYGTRGLKPKVNKEEMKNVKIKADKITFNVDKLINKKKK